MSASSEPDQWLAHAVDRVWDSYDAAVKDSQAEVIETTGRVLSGLAEVTALLPVSAVDLASTALRLDRLATDLAKAAEALKNVTS